MFSLARHVERTIIRTASGDNALMEEALEQKLAMLRQELAGPNPTPLERLLVERVALCWLQANYEDAMEAQHGKQSTSWASSLNYQKRADVAQRRFLSAVKTLATVRKLALPSLQVNIAAQGGQQVNVANLAAPPEALSER